MAGSGGVLLELVGVAFCAAGQPREGARPHRRTHAAELLRGYRGRWRSAGPWSRRWWSSAAGTDLEDVIESVDINPFVALPQGGMALDALIVLRAVKRP
jgi:hypothetical protein